MKVRKRTRKSINFCTLNDRYPIFLWVSHFCNAHFLRDIDIYSKIKRACLASFLIIICERLKQWLIVSIDVWLLLTHFAEQYYKSYALFLRIKAALLEFCDISVAKWIRKCLFSLASFAVISVAQRFFFFSFYRIIAKNTFSSRGSLCYYAVHFKIIVLLTPELVRLSPSYKFFLLFFYLIVFCF